MIINCMKRIEGYKPVKGNEKEIINHLLEHNYYDKFSFYKNMDRISAKKIKHIENEILNLKAEDYFKLNDDGSIISQKQPSFEDYVAMEFNLTNDFDWVNWLFNAPNIKSLHKNLNAFIKEWYTKPAPFQMQEGSILIFNKNSKTLHNVLNRTSRTIFPVLLENGYEWK